jgi:hypothetical protein
MESPALETALAAGIGAASALLLVAVLFLATRRRRSRADLEAMLAAAQRESDDLRQRLEELTGHRDRAGAATRGPAYLEELFGEPALENAVERAIERQQAEFVITSAGDPERVVSTVEVPDRLVLSATLGEPMVKVAAFSHGVRRALRAESRNRIWFEMKREVRAARKRRRRLVKDYLRETRARERANEGTA